MMNRLNEVSVAARLPYFVTATLPDDVFDDDVARFAKRAKVYSDNFFKRLRRVSPRACGFWRIEWKARLSGLHEGKLFPHFHFLVWGLEERSLGDYYKEDESGRVVSVVEMFEAFVDLPDSQLTLQLVNILSLPACPPLPALGVCNTHIVTGAGDWWFSGKRKFVERCHDLVDSLATERLDSSHPVAQRARKMSFADWASLAWYHVVGSQNTDHLKAGVRVERVRSWGGAMSYCAKYMSKVDCEFLSDVAFGRSWGVFNRAAMPWAKIIEMPLDAETGNRLRRVARRYLDRVCGSKRPRPYGFTLYCDVVQWSKLWSRPPDAPF